MRSLQVDKDGTTNFVVPSEINDIEGQLPIEVSLKRKRARSARRFLKSNLICKTLASHADQIDQQLPVTSRTLLYCTLPKEMLYVHDSAYYAPRQQLPLSKHHTKTRYRPQTASLHAAARRSCGRDPGPHRPRPPTLHQSRNPRRTTKGKRQFNAAKEALAAQACPHPPPALYTSSGSPAAGNLPPRYCYGPSSGKPQS